MKRVVLVQGVDASINYTQHKTAYYANYEIGKYKSESRGCSDPGKTSDLHAHHVAYLVGNKGSVELDMGANACPR